MGDFNTRNGHSFQVLRPVPLRREEYFTHCELLSRSEEDVFFLELGGNLMKTLPNTMKKTVLIPAPGHRTVSKSRNDSVLEDPMLIDPERPKLFPKLPSSSSVGDVVQRAISQQVYLANGSITSNEREETGNKLVPKKEIRDTRRERAWNSELQSLTDSLSPKFQPDSSRRLRKQAGHYKMMAAGMVEKKAEEKDEKKKEKEQKRKAANQKRQQKRLQSKQLKDSQKPAKVSSRSKIYINKKSTQDQKFAGEAPQDTEYPSRKLDELLRGELPDGISPHAEHMWDDCATVTANLSQESVVSQTSRASSDSALHVFPQAGNSSLPAINVFKISKEAGNTSGERIGSEDTLYFSAFSPTLSQSSSYSDSWYSAIYHPCSPDLDIFDLQSQIGIQNWDYYMRVLSRSSVNDLDCFPPGNAAAVVEQYFINSTSQAQHPFESYSVSSYGVVSSGRTFPRHSLEMDESVVEDALSLYSDPV